MAVTTAASVRLSMTKTTSLSDGPSLHSHSEQKGMRMARSVCTHTEVMQL